MLSIQRREEIKRYIIEKKTVSVADMAQLFSVSHETIRRDLAALESEGLVEKSYGGASLKRRVNSQVSQMEKMNLMIREKQSIAGSAALFVQQNDCIFLDHSTTVLAMCDLFDDIPMTVVTNSLQVLCKLSVKRNITVRSISGTFDPVTQAFWGVDTAYYVSEHFFDKVFFSCRCLNIDGGVYDSREDSANIRKSLVKNATVSYLLADHNKLGRSAFARICGFEDIDCFITDAPLSDEWTACFEKNCVEIRLGTPPLA